MSPTTGPHVANDSVLDVTAGARSAAAVIRHTPARGSLDVVDHADTAGSAGITVQGWSSGPEPALNQVRKNTLETRLDEHSELSLRIGGGQ
jgi:hypothetical protein